MNRKEWLAKRGNGGNLAKFYRSRSTYLFVSKEVYENKHKDEDGVEHTTYTTGAGTTFVTKKDENHRLRPRQAFIKLERSRRNNTFDAVEMLG